MALHFSAFFVGMVVVLGNVSSKNVDLYSDESQEAFFGLCFSRQSIHKRNERGKERIGTQFP